MSEIAEAPARRAARRRPTDVRVDHQPGFVLHSYPWRETSLVVDREAHKPIVIGKDGAKLREISRLARADIVEMLGKRVHLEVWVRVKKGWSDDTRALRTLGYE